MPASDRDEALRELGQIVRERREDARLSLESIYERTRVRVEFLQGIEQGDYQGFPDIVYIKGFVRTYLSVIGAEDLKDEFMSWLNKESTIKGRNLPPTNVLGNSTFPTKGFKPASHFWLFAVLFLVLLGAAAYVWYSWENSLVTFPDIVRDHNRVVDELVSEDTKSEDVFVPSSLDSAFLSILPASANVMPELEPEPAKPHLLIRAKGDVWMKVTIGNDVVFSNTLRSGSEASWDLPSRGKVTYGRPNMAEVILNGKNLGVANPRGSRTSETYFYEPDGTHRRVQ